jgi:deazaflavin-dependent oxidoreductase (nitroreductase family)
MMAVDPAVARALERGGAVEITTTGRRSGESRSVELAFHNVEGRVLLSGHPGFPRSWVANLRADPRLIFRLKGAVAADLAATARIVSDRGERERLLAPIAEGWRIDLAVMVASAPLVEVVFD